MWQQIVDAGGRLYCWSNREPILTIRRILWVLTFGWVLALFYFTYAVAMLVSIIFAPFSYQAARLGLLALDGGITLEPTPLGRTLVLSLESHAWNNPRHPFTIFANVVWAILFGWQLALMHLAAGLIQALTIVGFGTALVQLQLAVFAIWPFGRSLCTRQLPTSLGELHAQWEASASQPHLERLLDWV